MSSTIISLTRLVSFGAIAIGLTAVGAAQAPLAPAPSVITAADYQRAERFMTYNATPLVLHSVGRATWVSGTQFWYRTTTEKGNEAILVDAATATKSPCELPACKAPVQTGAGGGRGVVRTDAPSPDGKRTAFIRDWNLWVRDV